MTVGELTARGYYLGSNVSYNVKKMVENRYLTQERSPHDRRSVRIKLSDKGLTCIKSINESLDKQVAALTSAQISAEELLLRAKLCVSWKDSGRGSLIIQRRLRIGPMDFS